MEMDKMFGILWERSVMKQILIVDDDLNFRRSLVIQLELEGYPVKDAESADKAYKLLQKCEFDGWQPDVVITDVRMSGMGGEEFTMQLKNEYPDLPVIVLSAYKLPDALAGYPFLGKPFKLPQLIDCINNVIKSNRIR